MSDEPRGDGADRGGAVITVAIVAAAGGVGQGFGRFVFPALLPAMKRDILSSYGNAGFIGTANVAAYLAGAIGVMFASLRVPTVTILKAGLLMSTAAMFILASARGLPQLALGMLLAGVGGASIFVPGPAIARSVVRADRSGVAVGLISAGIGFALLVGTQLARVSDDLWGAHGWRWVWVIQGVVGAVICAVAWVVLRAPSSSPLARPRLSALRHIAGWLPYTIGYFVFGFGYIITITYTVASLRDGAGFSSAHAANVYALVAIGTMVGGLVIGRLSDALGRRPSLVISYAICAGCPLLLLVGSEPWAAIAGFGFGAFFAGAVVVVAAYAADASSPAEFSAAFAAVTVAFSIAQAFGPQVGGSLVDHTDGFEAALVTSAVAIGIAAVVSLALPRVQRAGGSRKL